MSRVYMAYRLYLVACAGLVAANRGELFAPSKQEAMKDINFWRVQCRIAARKREADAVALRIGVGS